MLSKPYQEKSKKVKFPEQRIINALLLGSKAVGKTTIGQRLAGKFYNNILLAETYGIDFHFLTLENGSSNIYIQIWDINFQNYKTNSPKYFIENADILMLVIDSEDSFKELKHYESLINKSKASLKYFLWNKIDKEQEGLTDDEVKSFVQKHNFRLFQISALKGTHFEEFNQNLREKVRVFSKRKD